jgi:phosphoserine aminotransferase
VGGLPRADPAIRSNTSVCLKVVDPAITALSADKQAAFAKTLVAAREGRRGFDIGALPRCASGPSHLVRRDGRGIRLEALTQWLDWAFAEAKASLAKAA